MTYGNYGQQPQWGSPPQQPQWGQQQRPQYGQQQQAPRVPSAATFSLANPMPSKYGNGMCAGLTLKAEGHVKGDKPLFKIYLTQNQYGFYAGLKLEQLQELHAAIGAYLAQRGVGAPSQQYAPVQQPQYAPQQYQQPTQGYAQPMYNQAPPQQYAATEMQGYAPQAQPIAPPVVNNDDDSIPF